MQGLKNRILGCRNYKIELRLHVLHFKLVSEQINAEDILERLEALKKQDFRELFFVLLAV